MTIGDGALRDAVVLSRYKLSCSKHALEKFALLRQNRLVHAVVRVFNLVRPDGISVLHSYEMTVKRHLQIRTVTHPCRRTLGGTQGDRFSATTRSWTQSDLRAPHSRVAVDPEMI